MSLIVVGAALVLVAVILAGLYFVFIPVIQSRSFKHALTYTHEYAESSEPSAKRRPFPTLYDAKPAKRISLIVPAYNETERLPKMLNETVEYLQRRTRDDSAFTWEIIVVDDGSRDDTTKVALQFVDKLGADKLRVLTLKKNQGKGGAVQQGMLHARGELLLMADADAATDINDLERLEKRMTEIEADGCGVVVGSRAHLEDEAVAQRSFLRNFLMYGFHFLVSTLCVKGVRDTQCGFKLFTRKAAKQLFANQQLRRWCFDVELLHLAQRLGFHISEVGVNWSEVPGSKLNVLESSVLMGRDLLVIRLAYMLGLWKVHDADALRLRLSKKHA